jgi:hypothetical protein
MKKPTKMLVVRRETLRVLATAELGRAAGGEPLAHQSGVKNCAAVPPLLPAG